MDISPQLRQKVLDCFEQFKPEILEIAERTEIQGDFMIFPFECDGVVDWAKYSKAEKRVIQITVMVGEGDEYQGLFPRIGDYGYFDKVRGVAIDIPQAD